MVDFPEATALRYLSYPLVDVFRRCQLLFAAKNLENKREDKMNAETEVKEFPWEDNDDFQDFDFDD